MTACRTPEQRRPCHEHEPRPHLLSHTQHQALGHIRTGCVRVLISACGPDSAVGASVHHPDAAFHVRTGLPGWQTYKVLYQAGVVVLRRTDEKYPYDYRIELNPAHPINKENP